MAKRLQLRRGTAAEINAFTGAIGEPTYNETYKTIVVHDGVTKGGIVLAKVHEIDENLLNYLPSPYPKATPPQGYLAMMGQTISKTTYPKLFALYGAVLPDLRGSFIRGYGGNSADIGVTQGDAIRNITGQLGRIAAAGAAGNVTKVFKTTGGTLGWGGVGDANNAMFVDFDASLVVPTANENRPINVAFLYIVKAG